MNGSPPSAPGPVPAPWPAAAFGVLLGLAILKFGNPVILEQQVGVPGSAGEWIQQPWPARLGFVLFGVLAGAVFLFTPFLRTLRDARLPGWLWTAAGAWLGWQFLSASESVDGTLTAMTLPHLVAVAASFALGVALGTGRWKPLLGGVAVGAAICWLQAINQHTVEFRTAREVLVTGEKSGWTNIPPEMLESFRRDTLVIRTNGVDIANPAIVDKLTRGRVYGTLVYPNALAGLVLLVFPALAAVLFQAAGSLRPGVRFGAFALLFGLAGGSLYWSGSRSGWLIALALVALAVLLQPRWKRVRIPVVIAAVVLGTVAFALKNRAYFEKGATSVTARFDYWKAAVQNTREHPVSGSGPGTFMRPYARLKAPEAEMARLVHNDYLQQFTDSGVPGGVAYAVWVLGALAIAARRALTESDPVRVGVGLGVLGWFAQGLSEFSLYVPALGWTAFVMLGVAVGAGARPGDEAQRSEGSGG